MRKLLSLLSVLTIGTVASTNVVACTHNKTNDQTNLPFLYHAARQTNLGNVKKNPNSILAAFFKANSNIKEDKTLTVSNITDKNASINVDQNDVNFKKGSLRVTFNTIESTNLDDLITIKNISVNRNLGDFSAGYQPTNITKKDVVDGINAMNGLNLQESDIDVEGLAPETCPTTITISATPGSKYQGENISLILNKDLDITKMLSNTDLGKIYIPEKLVDVFTDRSKYLFASIGCLMEYIGDANQILDHYKDQFASLNVMPQEGVMVYTNSQITLNIDKSKALKQFFLPGSVTFTFELVADNRLAIQDGIKTTDLGKLKDDKIDTIKDAIIAKNQAQLGKFSVEELKRYLIVTPDPANANSPTISWLPGSKQFLGHDPALMLVMSDFVIPPLTTTVSYTL